jgi:hypothetical protein
MRRYYKLKISFVGYQWSIWNMSTLIITVRTLSGSK